MKVIAKTSTNKVSKIKLPEDGYRKVLQNIGIIAHYTVSQPRRPQLESLMGVS
jgi:hypothetical protein